MYVMSQEAAYDDEISLLDFWNTLWEGKWLIVVITSVVGALSLVYAFTATEWYRADVLLAPADETSTPVLPDQLRGLSGLVGLAGITVGGGGSAEPIAILNSRDFTRAFIEDMNLLIVLFDELWDSEAGRWKTDDPTEWPDIRDAIKYFDRNIRSVSEMPDKGLVTLSIEWTEPEVAAEWANALVARLNNHMRQRALAEAEANVKYLQDQLAATSVAVLQESVGSLLETELQKLMLARGKEEFAFRVIDSAQIPKERARPNRTLFVAVAILFGGIVSVVSVLIRHAVRQRRSADVNDDDGIAESIAR